MGTVQHISVNGIRIAYESSGTGYPLLMLHGFPRTHHVWDKTRPALVERFTVVTPDRRGYGESDRPSDPDAYGNAANAADDLALMSHLGFKEFMVVGHDRGAPVAQLLAADHADRLSGAFIIDATPQGLDTGPRQDPSGRSWYFDFFRQRGVAEQIIGQNPGLFFSLFLDRNPHLSPEEHAFYVQEFSRPGTVESVLYDYRAGLELDPVHFQEMYDAGRKIKTPLYVIWGGRGPMGNSPVLDRWREVAERVDGEVVPDSAHYVQEERPETVVEHIFRFADHVGHNNLMPETE